MTGRHDYRFARILTIPGPVRSVYEHRLWVVQEHCPQTAPGFQCALLPSNTPLI
jgi:hypothetical protein